MDSISYSINEQAYQFYKVGWKYYIKNHLDSSIYYYDLAIRHYKLIKNYNGIASSLNKKCRTYILHDRFDKCYDSGIEALKIGKNISNVVEQKKRQATSYFYMSQAQIGKGNLQIADSLMKKSLNIRLKSYEKNNILVAHCYNELGTINSYLRYFEPANTYYKKASLIYRENNKTREFYSAINNILQIDLIKGNVERFIESKIKFLNEIKGKPALKQEVLISYYDLGISYRTKGDFSKALIYCNKSLNGFQEFYNYDKMNLTAIISTIGEIKRELNQYEEAIFYHTKALNNYKKIFNERHNRIAYEYNNIAITLFNMNDYNGALKYIRLSELYLSNKDYLALATEIENSILRGDVQYKLYNYSLAEINYKKALSIIHRNYGTNHSFTFFVSNKLVKLLIKLGRTEEAQKILEDIINKSDIDYKNNLNSKLHLIESLSILGQLYFRLHEIEINSNSWEYYFEKSIMITNELQFEFLSFESKKQLREMTNKVYDSFVESLVLKKKINSNNIIKTFKTIEKNKSGILIESLNELHAKNFASLPDSLRDKERDLKIDITFYNNKLNEENSKQNPDSARVTYYENVLFDFNRDYEALIDTLENKYPDYYDLKHRNYVASVDDVQKELLDDNAALVEYYYSDSAMYAFAITKNDYEVYELGVPKHFKQWLSNFRKAQTDARFLLDSAATANQLYYNSGNALFKHLLQPVLADLDSGITNLIIVPDGELGHINFETLLTDSVGSSSGSYADLPYLLKDYNIQYAYSATVLLSAKRHKRKAPAAFFAGFAPNYANLATTVAGDSSADQMVVELTRSGNYQLPGAISEVENLAALTGGDAFINTAASERAFKQNADRYQVLHLAMHGLVNDRDAMYSKLLFTQTEDTLEDNYLNAAEIFNLDLAADLVVLSACNTGYGQVNRGEGIMSLSRAFKYAGSPSLVMSLWQIPDQPTSAIMNRFYENLMAGQRKDVALRNAKLDFLSANRGNLRSHPFYWAGLIPIGDMQPLAVESWAERNMLLLAGLLLLLIIAVLVSRRMSTPVYFFRISPV
jgi:CHAT domain-containing protein/tetratricopeptide (TPR) repeat protein